MKKAIAILIILLQVSSLTAQVKATPTKLNKDSIAPTMKPEIFTG